MKDGHTAVAADSDQDLVWIVDLDAKTARSVSLEPQDEPGRVVEDGAGRVHVVLRRSGAIASIDVAEGTVVARRAVCPTPRGIAYDDAQDALFVACADGTLATFPAAGGAATRVVQLDRDLRDVLVVNGKLYVSRFRAAELLEVDDSGAIVERTTLPSATSMAVVPGPSPVITAVPSVAYRMIALPSGQIAMLHQRAQAEAVDTGPGGYSDFGMCPGVGIVHDAITVITPGTAPPTASPLQMVVVGVDLAVSPDGTLVAVAAPAGTFLGLGVSTFNVTSLAAQPGDPMPCAPAAGQLPAGGGRPIAVAFDPSSRLIVQTRDPAAISIDGVNVALPSSGPHSDGLDTFYMGTKGGIACASCHPEAGDDGRVWQFNGLGARRTQNIRGGVLARAPFHWSGDISDMDVLVSVVFETRMFGPTLNAEQVTSLGDWMNAQPALAAPAPADPQAVARGQQLFADPAVGCTSCHGGTQHSTFQLVDVGTGAPFKVPSLLGVGYRAPYLHDGCAATLLDRFGASCGGGDQHGHTSQLDAGQLSDLVAYLESL
jgi:mono/diheme cytochrome c family protein